MIKYTMQSAKILVPDKNSRSGRQAAASLTIAIVLLALGSIVLQRSGKVDAAPESSNGAAIAGANCRYGVAALGDQQVDWVDDFGAGWYLNFGRISVSASNNAEFAPVITVKQDKTADGTYLPSFTITPELTDNGLGSVVDARPGALWIVGNEVDRGPNSGEISVDQGDTYPDIYARAYHDVYYFIKNRDPSAQIANSALVEVTPGRLQYLDIMWDAYLEMYNAPMPVDVWNMHIYILPEVNINGEQNDIASVALGTDPALGRRESYDPDGAGPLEPKDTCHLDDVYCYAEHDDMNVFAENALAMRRWMKEKGQQNKPLILSEFSILYPYEDDGPTCFLQDEYGNCFTHERIINFQNSAFTLLETSTDPNLGYPQDGYRLVQQWLWFSVNTRDVAAVSNLVGGSPTDLTAIGQNFKEHVANQTPTINLFSDLAAHPSVFTETPGGTTDVSISASLRNNGNHAPLTSFEVTFYEDAALSQPIGSATVPPPGINRPGLTGCARRDIVVDTLWEGLSTGTHRYWVEIDSGDQIDESDEGDNIIRGFVIVNPRQSYSPVIFGP